MELNGVAAITTPLGALAALPGVAIDGIVAGTGKASVAAVTFDADAGVGLVELLLKSCNGAGGKTLAAIATLLPTGGG